ncbi:MAG: glycosyltransferase family 4 protein [Candidatus Aerophobus sp.]|nr:MAG: glycosyltransferase family 4 protein [Candidatus Aerophobus sp.]
MESRKVKVVILGAYPPATGGIATNIQNLLKSPLGERFTLLKFRTMSKKCGTSEYYQEKIFTKIGRVILDLLLYLFFLQKESPQIVHINTSLGIWAFWRDSIYLLISKMFRKKVLFQIHGGKLNEFWSRSCSLTKVLIRQIFKMPELIAVLSSVQRKPFAEIGLAKKVKVVPNTVDISRYNNRGNCRTKFGIPEKCIVVLFVASLFNKEKGVMELLKAIPLVTKKYEKVLFIFVGGGKEEHSMLEFCQKEKLEKYVKFTGYLHNDTLIQILKSSDIFTLPSYREGLPLVILEAMAAGLPIVATPVGAIPEFVNNGENGFLVKSMDHIWLAEKIGWLIGNGELRKKIGNNNIKKIREDYDSKIVATIFEDIYNTILAANGGL